MSRARDKALAKKRDRSLRATTQIHWDAYEMLLRSGKTAKEAAESFGLRAETVAGRCKKEFGMTLAQKFPDLYGDPTSRKPISWDKARSYFQTGAPASEVAALLNISVPTLARRCVLENGMELKEWGDMHFAKTRVALRQTQVRVALGKQKTQRNAETGEMETVDEVQPNTPMLMHLGKHMLGQTEKTETTIAVVGVPDQRKKELRGLLELDVATTSTKSGND